MSMTKRFVMKNLFYFPKVLGLSLIQISGIRIKVEHAIGGMKKCRIVKERFRCHKFGFEDMVILIACGLHNFRISHKMSHITN